MTQVQVMDLEIMESLTSPGQLQSSAFTVILQ